MKHRISLRRLIALVATIPITAAIVGCGSQAPAPSLQSTDPSGQGMTIQQRIKTIQDSNMPDRYKARKIQMLEAQMNHTAPPPPAGH